MTLLTSQVANINFTARAIQQLQQNVSNALNAVLNVPIVNGNFFPSLSLAGGSPITITHKLNQAYRGYWVVRADNALAVWDDPLLNTAPKTSLVLSFSGTATLMSIWIF